MPKPPQNQGKRRVVKAPPVPVYELSAGMEWILPHLAYAKARRYYTTAQAKEIIGCSTSELHLLIEHRMLHAHKNGGSEKAHWRIHPISVVRFLWEGSNAKSQDVPLLAEMAMLCQFARVLPLSAARLMRDLLNEHIGILEHTAAVTGITIPELPVSTLDSAVRESRRPAGPSPAAAVQTHLL